MKPVPPHLTEPLRRALEMHRAGNLAAAESVYAGLIDEAGEHEVVLCSYASAIMAQDRPKDAQHLLEKAVAVAPDYAQAHIFLGEVYRQLARFDDALTEIRRGLDINPRYLEAHIGLGDLLVDLYRLDEALQAFDVAMEMKPKSPLIGTKRAQVRFYLGDIDRAEVEIREILQRYPNHAEAHWVLSCICLAKGAYDEGWREYASRWSIAKTPPATSRVDKPIWDGGSLRGKSLLVWPEQGLGDEIMFVTCIPQLLRDAGPARCVYVCDRRLAPLLERTFPALTVVPTDKVQGGEVSLEVPNFDVQTCCGDLPQFLRRSADSFKEPLPAFQPDPEKLAKWRQRINALGPGPKIGIAWRGGMTLRIRSRKSAPLDFMPDLLRTPGAHFINLQYGNVADDLARMKADSGITVHHWDDLDAIADPDDQLAQIACLDLVIQTSNASAHMAGALGRPVWNMIPFIPEWRWLLEGEHCLWYPTMRLFRQPELGNWAPVFARVAGDLSRFVAEHKG